MTISDTNNLLTVKQASELTGISIWALYSAIYRDKLPVDHSRRKIRIRHEDLLVWRDDPELHQVGNPHFGKSLTIEK